MAEAEEVKSVAVRQKTLADLLEKYKAAMLKAAPKWFNVDRALMVARLAYSRSPRLLKADPLSIVAAVAAGAQLGLEPCGAGGIHLVPFWNSRRNRYEAQPITDYRALISLTRRSGHVSTFDAHIAYKNDHFSYQLGTKPALLHKPTEGERGDMTHAYAIARLKDGAYQFEVMTKAECEHHRDRFSKAAQEGPWLTDFEAMCAKTVARKLCKWLPMTVEIQQVIEREEKAEAGEPEDLSGLLGLEELPPDDNGGNGPRPTGKLGKLTETLEQRQHTPPAQPTPTVTRAGDPPVEGARQPVGGTKKTTASAPEAGLSGASRGADVDTGRGAQFAPVSGPGLEVRKGSELPPETGQPPAGDLPPTEIAAPPGKSDPGPTSALPIDREALLGEIAALMRSLKVNPKEEQFLWGKFGAGAQPIPTEHLSKLLAYLLEIQPKVTAKGPKAKR